MGRALPLGAAALRALEHRCRYTRAQLLEELEEAGFTVESCRDFNRAGRERLPGTICSSLL